MGLPAVHVPVRSLQELDPGQYTDKRYRGIERIKHEKTITEENRFTLAIRFYADGRLSYDTVTFEMPFVTENNNRKSLEYLKQAVYDYTNSNKGQMVMQKNNGMFRWLDILKIPPEFLARYNIHKRPFDKHINCTVDSDDPIRDIRNE